MKLTVFNENDSILLLGEGNFSFSVALFQLNYNINITATCYETNIDQDVGKKNIEYLGNNGVRVLLGVNATNLKEHQILKTQFFDKILFNFPHVGGKMRIEKNRELLRQFFMSSSELLKNNGQILVTLCNGQGGTPFDNPPRRWDDSWKITEMAAHGNFILTTVEPFIFTNFQNYVVTGYRSLDKQFHSAGALTHIFVKSEAPNIENIAPKHKIDISKHNSNHFSWNDIKQIVNVSDTHIRNLYTHAYMFDITFSIDEKFHPMEFYVLLYNYAGHIVDNVDFLRSYESPILKTIKMTYRISYRSACLPLNRQRIISIHKNLIANILESNLNVVVSR